MPPALSAVESGGASHRVPEAEPEPRSEAELEPPPARAAPGSPWMSFDHWAIGRGLPSPERRSGSLLPVYDLRTPQGVLSVTLDSRVARWNGVVLALGFTPRANHGMVMTHPLDLEKNFEPLLSPPARYAGNRRSIVLDPGHGGRNRGAQSVHSLAFEKQYTLDWALRLVPLLEARGWKVFLTRTNDVDVALSQRVSFANSVGAGLFVSLHFNSVPPAQAKPEHTGIETYCLTPAGMPSNLVREFEDDPDRRFPNNAFDAENLKLALQLQRSLARHTGAPDRGVRRARFMTVLQGQERPSVLLEGGFLTHPEEARRISSPAYRQKLAEAVVLGLGD